VWNGGLQGIKAIVEWQQCVFTEGDDQRFFLLAKNRRARLPRPHVGIADRTASAPFGHGLWIDAVAGGELPQARLTILYCSTDRLSRCGAAVKNLPHSSSLRRS
jgi:hypothetical protein